MTSYDGLYYVLVDKRVEKDLEKVPKYIVDRFSKILNELEVDPINMRPGVDNKNLRGCPNIFIAVMHRKKAYRIFEDSESYKAGERAEKEIQLQQ